MNIRATTSWQFGVYVFANLHYDPLVYALESFTEHSAKVQRLSRFIQILGFVPFFSKIIETKALFNTTT